MIENNKLIKNICGKYFLLKEFYCKCNLCQNSSSLKAAYAGLYKDPECDMKKSFLKKLMIFRLIYRKKTIISSGYRCIQHPNYSSNHDGYAVDILYRKNNVKQRMKIVKAAIRAGFNRIGISNDFIHIDNNPEYNFTINKEVLWIYPGAFNK